MSKLKQIWDIITGDITPEPQQPTLNVDTHTLRNVEDATAVLEGLATRIEANNGSASYVQQIRANAEALKKITADHPERSGAGHPHSALHDENAWAQVAAHEHATEIRVTLK